ncbi:hypothetical protein [Frateuria terrea]|uniref:Phage infection protein n=1 Tax=Frateuria terrea TaxID=529704 RepID=A0A1H6WRC6_9GAMM|nr:hypothetical protein [Frateuria terrea]SEJ16797.1 hypothetical protein SAMN04487997_2610 [Frateuria terrea]SFP56035.1 hypothetical protein SAMN02927913_2587 [Frateuria terrea]
MHKTLLAALIGASVFAVLPALAQVSLGGAGQVGAGLAAGANGTLPAPGQLTRHADQALPRTERHARHATGHARDTFDRHGRTDAEVGAKGSADAQGSNRTHADTGVRAGASVDAGTAVDRAAGTAQGVGDRVDDSAHAAIDRTGHASDAAGRTATETSVGADANVRARADAHGH